MCSIWSQSQSVASLLLSVGSAPSQLAQGLLMARYQGEVDLLQIVTRSNVSFFLQILLGHPGKMSPVKPISQSPNTDQMTVLAASSSLTLCLQLKMQVCLQVCLHRWHVLTTLSSKVNGFYLKLFYLIYSFLRQCFTLSSRLSFFLGIQYIKNRESMETGNTIK